GNVRATQLPGRRASRIRRFDRDRVAQLMEVTFLGSGNAFASEGRYWSSFLVDRRYLFDAPPTLLAHLKRLKVDLPEIEVIFLSHHHGDHFVGLPFLLLEYLYMSERSKEL